MKGVILAGDSGDKLFPLSLGVPKQLLPIFDKPMIYYPIEILAKAGITDLLVITSNTQQKAFVDTLGDGHNLNVRITYAIQQKPEGIAQAITIASDFIGIDQVCLITGDTLIFGKPFLAQLGKAIKAASKSANATIFVADHVDGEQYGKLLVGQTPSDKQLIGIGENTAREFYISGIYVYPNNVEPDVTTFAPSRISTAAPVMLVVTLMVPSVATNFSDFFRPPETLINTRLTGCE